jgi:hypothetical protein
MSYKKRCNKIWYDSLILRIILFIFFFFW